MNTEQFMTQIMPQAGLKVICTQETSQRAHKTITWFKPHYFNTVSEAAKAALDLDALGNNVFYAVNSYGQNFRGPNCDQIYRTRANVVACRSLYDDLDIDPENIAKYDSKQAARVDIARFEITAALDLTIIDSGGGYHLYTSLDEDADLKVWTRLSAKKRAINRGLGLKTDLAVDMDAARILRPLGAHNRKQKYPTPQKVKLLKRGTVYSVEQFEAKLDAYLATNNITLAADNGLNDNPHKTVQILPNESRVTAALQFIDPNPYDVWTAVAYWLQAAYGNDALPLWLAWSDTASGRAKAQNTELKYHPTSFWHELNPYISPGAGAGSLFAAARDNAVAAVLQASRSRKWDQQSIYAVSYLKAYHKRRFSELLGKN